jgi:putative methyltransferase (TIGR04325 family)
MSFELKDTNSIWVGIFVNLEDVISTANVLNATKSPAFETRKWLIRQSEMLNSAKVGIASRHSTLPVLSAVLKSEREIKIYDLGGGSGWVYQYMKAIGCGPINYINQELSVTVKEFQEHFEFDSRVVFTEIPMELNDIDILYSNSVIQYFENLNNLFSLISKIKPTYILLDDVQVSNGTDFFSLQRYYDKFIPTKFYDVSKIVVEMERIGYKLLLKSDYPAIFSDHMMPTISERNESALDRDAPLVLLFADYSVD